MNLVNLLFLLLKQKRDGIFFSNSDSVTGWLIAYGWLWRTKASFLHSRQLLLVELSVICVVTIAAVLKCPDIEVASAPKKFLDSHSSKKFYSTG